MKSHAILTKFRAGGVECEFFCNFNPIPTPNISQSSSEKDLGEVLQTETVFANVSKGQVAKKDDLMKAFSKADHAEICREILEKGELQVTEKERHATLDSTFKEIATLVADKTVNPETNRPYPVTMIEKSMKDSHYSIKPNKNVKSQALDVIKLLKEHIPIEKAQMRVKITVKDLKNKKIRFDILPKLIKSKEHESWEGKDGTVTCLIDPGCFKEVEGLRSSHNEDIVVEVLDLKHVEVNEEVF